MRKDHHDLDDKKLSRGISRDMSPQAIARRFEIVAELRALSLKLGRAKKIELKKG